MNDDTSQSQSLLKFFAWLFALSVPFWVLGGIAGQLPLPLGLPASALMFVCPLIAASVLSYRQGGLAGVKALLGRVFDYKRIRNKLWYLPILGSVPVLYVLAYGVMRWAGMPLPDTGISLVAIPVLFLVFFVTAACEEVGWTGYALDPLQRRRGALTAAIALGVVWQLWHVIPHLQQSHTAGWIVWQSLYSVALRVLMVWIYNNTGKSVFAATLVHASDNVSVALFPNQGSHYDPFVTGVLAWLSAAVVIFLWGPKTLARYKGTSAPR